MFFQFAITCDITDYCFFVVKNRQLFNVINQINCEKRSPFYLSVKLCSRPARLAPLGSQQVTNSEILQTHSALHVDSNIIVVSNIIVESNIIAAIQ